ncbi:MAG: RNase P subunit p30 family protein [Haloferacaceae archaeon]
MYEAVTVPADDRASLAPLVAGAASVGYDGLVVRDGAATLPDADLDLSSDLDLDPDLDFDLVPGATVDVDPDAAGGAVHARRHETTLLCLRGGTPARNRFAVEEPRVDVLAGPVGPGASEAFPFDHVLARAAARNGVRVAFDLGPVLRETGGTRVRAVSALTRLRDLVETYDAPHVVTAAAGSALELRGPRALAAVGETVGLGREFVEDGLREWERVVARNRDRASEDWVMPGVRRGRYDPADWERDTDAEEEP